MYEVTKLKETSIISKIVTPLKARAITLQSTLQILA